MVHFGEKDTYYLGVSYLHSWSQVCMHAYPCQLNVIYILMGLSVHHLQKNEHNSSFVSLKSNL